MAGSLVVVWPKVRLFYGGANDRTSKVLERGDPVPDDLDVTQRENLLSFGAIAGALVDNPLAAEDDEGAEFSPEEGGDIPTTMAWVGDDAARAQAVLDVEVQRNEAKQRTSLIEQLDAVIAGK